MSRGRPGSRRSDRRPGFFARFGRGRRCGFRRHALLTCPVGSGLQDSGFSGPIPPGAVRSGIVGSTPPLVGRVARQKGLQDARASLDGRSGCNNSRGGPRRSSKLRSALPRLPSDVARQGHHHHQLQLHVDGTVPGDRFGALSHVPGEPILAGADGPEFPTAVIPRQLTHTHIERAAEASLPRACLTTVHLIESNGRRRSNRQTAFTSRGVIAKPSR